MSTINPLSLGATALNANLAYGANSAALARAKTGTMTNARARAAAEDFEAVFLNSMFSQMMTHVEGDGPFGGSQATGVWRSFLVNEYSRSFAKAGGIGLAKHVYNALIAQQEARAK